MGVWLGQGSTLGPALCHVVQIWEAARGGAMHMGMYLGSVHVGMCFSGRIRACWFA